MGPGRPEEPAVQPGEPEREGRPDRDHPAPDVPGLAPERPRTPDEEGAGPIRGAVDRPGGVEGDGVSQTDRPVSDRLVQPYALGELPEPKDGRRRRLDVGATAPVSSTENNAFYIQGGL